MDLWVLEYQNLIHDDPAASQRQDRMCLGRVGSPPSTFTSQLQAVVALRIPPRWNFPLRGSLQVTVPLFRGSSLTVELSLR